MSISVGIRQYVSGALAQILKKTLLVQEQTIAHIKAPIVSFFVPEERGRGNTIGATHSLLKRIVSRKK